MARTRRPRLSWVRWFWGDFDGGTKLFSDKEVGQYQRLLHLQLDSGKRQAFALDGAVRRVLTTKPTARVLEKFDHVQVAGVEMFRNTRMAEEAWSAREEVATKGWRKGASDADDTPDDTPTKGPPKVRDTSHPQNHPHSHPQEPAPQPPPENVNGLSAPPAPTADCGSPDTPQRQDGARTKARRNEQLATREPKPKGGWVGRACDLWTEIKGGVVAYGRMGTALKPLVAHVRKRNGIDSDAEAWEKIEPWYRSYLETSDDSYCSPEAFAKAPRSGTSQGSAKARARDEGMRAGIEGGLREE